MCCNLLRVTSQFISLLWLIKKKKKGILYEVFVREREKSSADLGHTVISLFFARLQGFLHFDASHGCKISKCGFVRSVHVSQMEKDRRGGMV